MIKLVTAVAVALTIGLMLSAHPRVPVAAAAFIILLTASACGGPDPKAPTARLDSRSFETANVGVTLYVAAHEAPPPGFRPWGLVSGGPCRQRESRITPSGGVVTLGLPGAAPGTVVNPIRTSMTPRPFWPRRIGVSRNLIDTSSSSPSSGHRANVLLGSSAFTSGTDPASRL